jgi:hypothetical protein
MKPRLIHQARAQTSEQYQGQASVNQSVEPKISEQASCCCPLVGNKTRSKALFRLNDQSSNRYQENPPACGLGNCHALFDTSGWITPGSPNDAGAGSNDLQRNCSLQERAFVDCL